jgi:hypothetical protein
MKFGRAFKAAIAADPLQPGYLDYKALKKAAGAGECVRERREEEISSACVFGGPRSFCLHAHLAQSRPVRHAAESAGGKPRAQCL